MREHVRVRCLKKIRSVSFSIRPGLIGCSTTTLILDSEHDGCGWERSGKARSPEVTRKGGQRKMWQWDGSVMRI